MNRLWLAVTAVTLAGALAGPAPSQALGGAQADPPSGVSWQSAGDSYSSGEGVFGNRGDCAQSDQAYGPVALGRLQKRGWSIASQTFTACTGHLVEDYFNARKDSGNKSSLWGWSREQGGPERVDVITMSFGGNDIGFADLLVDCLDLPTWGDLTGAGCDPSEQELNGRVDALLDPPRRSCVGSRRTGAAGYDCDLDIGDRRGSIIDFYYDVVTQHLSDRGRLYIVGYPRIFAPVDQWPGWVKGWCQGISRGDTEKLGRVGEHLNDKLREAAGRANQALGSERVIYFDRLALYRDGNHELCGTGDDWLNGIAMDRGEGLGLRKETSFHPNAAGHAGVASALADRVDATFPRQDKSSSWQPLARRGVSPSERRAFEDLLNATRIPSDNSLDQNGRCFGIDVYGWSPGGDADIILTYDPELVDHGHACGGDPMTIAYIVRGREVVAEAMACDCGDNGDTEGYVAIRDRLADDPASELMLFTDSDGHSGWYIFAG